MVACRGGPSDHSADLVLCDYFASAHRHGGCRTLPKSLPAQMTACLLLVPERPVLHIHQYIRCWPHLCGSTCLCRQRAAGILQPCSELHQVLPLHMAIVRLSFGAVSHQGASPTSVVWLSVPPFERPGCAREQETMLF